MAKPSISMPDELLESFDKTMHEAKKAGELDMDKRRSQLVRELMKNWIEENRESEKGNCQSTTVMRGSS